MSLASHPLGAERALGITRRHTTPDVDVYDLFDWERRDARIHDWRDGTVAFEQLDIEVPTTWSVNASNILAQKYFRGTLGSSTRESSLRQVVDRVVDTITRWGAEGGYFTDDEEAEAFRDELKFLIVSQRAAFNSPVWFNIGVEGVPQQASACFILSVDDTMESILNWYAEEGMIFKGGSGAGVNLSRIRSASEGLDGGGTASGPVSFMRGADASAGTIKSGGKTRRAAKMVMLDVAHPDVQEFVWCKAKEEQKARALRDAGFDMDLDGADSFSIQYQNANNSVRVTDEFMEAVVADDEWSLRAVLDGSVVKTVRARDLLRDIATAAWECADPGVQYDTTINRWHTTPSFGRINGSNPCSEYMHVDDSACNLASINLLPFHRPEETGRLFEADEFVDAIELVFAAQEIIVGQADYPTERIGENTRRFRQLGLGYANLGALLMAIGAPYDSERGRAVAAAVTALMGGSAYNMSTRLAARVGAFEGYEDDAESVKRVLGMHRSALNTIDADLVPQELLGAAHSAWDDTCVRAAEHGVRNAQATVLAPTGTISFLMDCDTTGIEPDLGLVKTKKLVGGGTMQIVNQGVGRALSQLGYSTDDVDGIVAHIAETGSVLGAPGLADEHVAVFACSMGDNVIEPRGHVLMMAAVQPFLSGAISKTVNLPESTTVEEVEQVFIDSWTLGLKAVALYRDNCKVGQPMSAKSATDDDQAPQAAIDALVAAAAQPVREKLPRSRASRTFEFRVADCKGFVTVGEYADGRPGELFIRVSKQGSTLAGIMDAFAISVSHGLQYGVPIGAFVDAFVGMRFEPAGMTDDPDLRITSSLMDYLFRRLAVEYLPEDERRARNILTTGERSQPTLPGVDEAVTETSQGLDMAADPPSSSAVDELCEERPSADSQAAASDAPFCGQCGTQMVRAGSCYACRDCGSTSGCS
ncbi:MAG: vitamin B12-dependent ribonucleotide reductase [Acidimicrobiia bacterium]|nr:vitamin B12-dependent ribonucleotide reductase [Acidimicrobiia bacterium]